MVPHKLILAKTQRKWNKHLKTGIFSFLMKNEMNMNDPFIYLLKVNNRNTRTRCEICSKLTIKIPERRLRFQY